MVHDGIEYFRLAVFVVGSDIVWNVNVAMMNRKVDAAKLFSSMRYVGCHDEKNAEKQGAA